MKLLLLVVLCFIILTFFSFVQPNPTSETPKKYIVHVRNYQKPVVFPTIDNWYRTRLDSLTQSPRNIFHIYRTVFHGFATELTKEEVELIKTQAEVLGVYPSRILKLHTTRTPEFLGILKTGRTISRLLNQSDYGSQVVIGIIDTGIWPERLSFNEDGLGSVPSHWNGECVEGHNFNRTLCNKKLIGARFFHTEVNPSAIMADISARDYDGHGTHTSSTIAGRDVLNASLFGYAPGVASGIATKARIAVYKVCWPGLGCSIADIVAAYDKAVEDGVDILSYSIGDSDAPHYYEDPVAIAQFGAMESNVFVSASAGNDGPSSSTVSNISPWITTVGAGTIDRKFPTDLRLANGIVLSGESIYSGPSLPKETIFPLVYVGDLYKSGALDPRDVNGKIVVCEEWDDWLKKEEEVKNVGGIGMVIADKGAQGGDLELDAHVLPTIILTKSAAENVLSYLALSKNPHGTIISRGTELNVKPAPLVAQFSSRGPNRESKYIIKPDLIAPGVNILAAWPDVGPTYFPSDRRQTEFNILSGTSMSCPHISGVAALLKGAHPDWSPARIKSAIMTTSYVVDNVGNHLLDGAIYETATAWDYGSGHVDPEKALDPGLVYDLTVDDYVDFLCASNYTEQEIKRITHRSIICKKGLQPWNLNYPSISVPFDQSNEIFVTRRATQVSEGPSSYVVKIENPIGVTVTVDPPRLDFTAKDQTLSYKIKIVAEKIQSHRGKSKIEFGRMTWQDGEHTVQMPIAVTLSGCYNHFSLFNSASLSLFNSASLSLLTLTLLVLFI